MTLKQKIQEDLKTALKEKKEIEVSTLRLLGATILNKEKEKRYKLSKPRSREFLSLRGKEKPEILEISEEELVKQSQLDDDEIIEVVSSEIKKRKEAIVEFEKGKREDLVKKEKQELEILEKYLPEQLSEEEIQKLAREVIEKVGAKEIHPVKSPVKSLQGKFNRVKDIGKVMAELMPKVKGRADGTVVSKIVKDLLTPKE